MREEKIKRLVREGYAKIARQENPCWTPVTSRCESIDPSQDTSRKIGYTEEELKTVPEGTNLGLGCGNPVALASLREGEIVLDLGSGAGFDCFLAANKVGEEGRVIGVDATPEMIEKARENVKKGNYENIDFRLGEIEDLPVADNSVDVVISNCVINLSLAKRRVFQESFRVLKPGGRMVISDIVLLKKLPDFIKNSIEAYIGCLSGAMMKDEYIRIIEETGFTDLKIMKENPFPVVFMFNDPTVKSIIRDSKIPARKLNEIANSVASITVKGVKPT